MSLLFITFKLFKINQLVTETRKSLVTTIKVMDEISKQNEANKAEIAKQEVKMKPVTLGSNAPNFSLKDENNKNVILQDYVGKKVVLVISDPQCENCKSFYSVLNKFIASNRDVSVLILLIETTPKQNKLYKKEHNINCKLLATPAKDVIKYGIQSTPTTIIIDEEGVIRGVKVCSTIDELTHLMVF